MKDNKNTCGLDDYLKLFEDKLTKADVLASTVLAKISTELVKRRLLMDMSIKEFSKFLNVDLTVAAAWEDQDYDFSIKELAKLSEKLGLIFSIEFEDDKNAIL